MPRRAQGDGPKELRIPTTAKLRAYLNDLKVEQGYGDDATNIAKGLIWRAIEELINRGILDRRKRDSS